MTMDNTEIINTYRAAADKKAQLNILADLNLCSKAQIAEILLEAGEKVDGRWYCTKPPFQKRRPETAPPAEADQPTEDKPAAGDAKTVTLTLTKRELSALQKFLDEELALHISVKTDGDDVNLMEIHLLTSVWVKVKGGKT